MLILHKNKPEMLERETIKLPHHIHQDSQMIELQTLPNHNGQRRLEIYQKNMKI